MILSSGIQEALSYCKQNQIYKCALLEGTFYIDNGVTLLLPYLDVTTATPLNEFVGIDFHGQNNGGTTIQQKDISTTQTVPLIAWENNGGSNYIKDNLPYVYAYSSGLEFNTNWHIHDFTVYANVSPPSTGYAIGISAVNLAQGEATPRCKLERLTIVNNGVMVNASTPTGTLSASCLDMSGHEGSMIEKCQLKAPNSVMSLIWINGYGSGLIQDSEMYCGTIPSGVTSKEVVAAIGGAILSVRNTWYATYPSINIYNSNSSNQNEFVQIGDYGPTHFRYFNYPITTADGVGALNLKIQIINSQDINSSPMVVHDFTGNNSVIVVEKDGNSINTISSYTDGVFVGNTNPGSYVKFASTSSSAGGIVAPNLTTPTVPASGTAQQNTNPYAVDVYVYGGDVTEIQITKNGTAYTVLSVSTAIAMSGQAYKLNPDDSITVTYSTAPSWEWLTD